MIDQSEHIINNRRRIIESSSVYIAAPFVKLKFVSTLTKTKPQQSMILCKVTAIVVFAIIITMLSSFKNAGRIPLSKRLSYRSMSSSVLKSQQIVEHPSFDKVESFHVQEFGFQGALYKHRKSGAQVNRQDNFM